MKAVCKAALCCLLSFVIIFCFSACFGSGKSESTDTTAQAFAGTTEAETAEAATSEPAATDDEEEQTSPTVNYSRLKRDADTVSSMLDTVIVGKRFRGTVYFKIGNDFEYIGSNGMADKDTRTENSINTVYLAGSVTKQITAAAIMLLQERGELSVDDSLDKYYPDYEYGESVTVKNLLTMTAGLADYVSRNTSDTAQSSTYRDVQLPYEISADGTAEENREAILDWILSEELQGEPGEEFSYSNSAYFLLGDIIEKVSGMSYEDFVYENIFEPLNMNGSSFDADDCTAVGYQEIYDNEWCLYPGVAYSSSGLVTNINDMLIWIDAVTGDGLLSEESREEMFTPFKSNFAYGVYVDSYGNYYIESSIYRFNSLLYYSGDKSCILAAFSNYTQSYPSNITGEFEKILSKYTG